MKTSQEQLEANLKQIDDIEELNLNVFKQVTKEIIRNLQQLNTNLETLAQLSKVVKGTQENQKEIVEKLVKQKQMNDMFTQYIEATNSIIAKIVDTQ